MEKKKNKYPVYFNTSEYNLAHGHNPRGYGSWAFQLRDLPDEKDWFWSHQSIYTQAKTQASEHFRKIAAEKGAEDGYELDIKVLT